MVKKLDSQDANVHLSQSFTKQMLILQHKVDIALFLKSHHQSFYFQPIVLFWLKPIFDWLLLFMPFKLRNRFLLRDSRKAVWNGQDTVKMWHSKRGVQRGRMKRTKQNKTSSAAGSHGEANEQEELGEQSFLFLLKWMLVNEAASCREIKVQFC